VEINKFYTFTSTYRRAPCKHPTPGMRRRIHSDRLKVAKDDKLTMALRHGWQ